MKPRANQNDNGLEEQKLDHALFTNNFHGLREIIFQYAFSEAPGNWLNNNFTHFSKPDLYLKWEILSLVYYALPFERVERCIQKAFARRQTHLPETMMEAITLALQNYDVTLTNKNSVCFYGLANQLLALDEKLYPCLYKTPDRLIQIRNAIPTRPEEQKDPSYRSGNARQVAKVFSAVYKNKDDMNDSIEAFINWAKTTTLPNLLILIFMATKMMTRMHKNFDGTLMAKFCNEVIRGLQLELSFWIKRLLKEGIDKLDACPQYINRSEHFDLTRFLSGSTNNYYYNAYGTLFIISEISLAVPLFKETIWGKLFEAITKANDILSEELLMRVKELENTNKLSKK